MALCLLDLNKAWKGQKQYFSLWFDLIWKQTKGYFFQNSISGTEIEICFG